MRRRPARNKVEIRSSLGQHPIRTSFLQAQPNVCGTGAVAKILGLQIPRHQWLPFTAGLSDGSADRYKRYQFRQPGRHVHERRTLQLTVATKQRSTRLEIVQKKRNTESINIRQRLPAFDEQRFPVSRQVRFGPGSLPAATWNSIELLRKIGESKSGITVLDEHFQQNDGMQLLCAVSQSLPKLVLGHLVMIQLAELLLDQRLCDLKAIRSQYCDAWPRHDSLWWITVALKGPPPINIDIRNDAVGGSASNALLSAVSVPARK